jgi:glycosyltransferase involved in cell wall biosynthesis
MTKVRREVTLKVAILYPQLTHFGGAERVVLSIARNYDTTIFTGTFDPLHTHLDFQNFRIKTYQNFFARVPVLKTYEGALRSFLLNVETFDVINPHIFPNTFVSLRFGSRTVWYCHAPLRPAHDNKAFLTLKNLKPVEKFVHLAHGTLQEALDTIAMRRVAKILTNSHVSEKRIAKFYNRKATVVYPGINPKLFKREDFGDFLLYVGGLSRTGAEPYKRPELAINAMSFLKHKQLYVVGEGKQKKILEASAPKNVKFLGNVSDETLRDLYARCLAVLYPSYDEEFGFVPIEGMASGKPVIACIDGGGVRETIINGETGFLVEPKSEEIAVAVRKLEDRSLLLKMSENAMQRCLMFSEEKFIEGINQNFELLG